MLGIQDQPRGNVQGLLVLGVTLSPASVATISTAEQTFTVPGLLVGDTVVVAKPAAQVGLALGSSRVSANNTLAITFVNPTAAPIVPTAAEVYIITVFRPSFLPVPNAVQ